MSVRLRYRESRQNHRPLFFAKFFALVANATSVGEALGRLIAPNLFVDWAAHVWPSSPRQPSSAYRMAWYRSTRTQAPPPTRHQRPSLSAHPGPGPDHRSSSTAPPVVSPFDFVAYGAPRPPCHPPCPLPPSRATTAHTCSTRAAHVPAARLRLLLGVGDLRHVCRSGRRCPCATGART